MTTEAESGGETASYWYDVDDTHGGEAVRVLEALRRFRSADRTMRQRTQGDMDMNETDLAALRFMIAAERDGRSVGATELAHHLAISTAATTKLVKRLSASGHVMRLPHPSDGRAQVLRPTPGAHDEVRKTLGEMHARMMAVADSLDPDEQHVVMRFLTEMAEAVTRNDD
ncbi:MAG: MarR family transcriptional regulator [Leifsonia sp.]